MKVDISRIIKVNGADLDLDFTQSSSDLRLASTDWVIEDPVSFKGKLFNASGVLDLEGKIKTGYHMKCQRCLEEVKGQLNTHVKESILNAEGNEDPEAYIYEGNTVDLEKVLRDNIILNMPTSQLCQENCKGICPVCGNDRNKAPCECKEESLNPQLAKLKEFFQEKE